MTYIDKCLVVACMLLLAMAIVAQGEADRRAIEYKPTLSPRPAIVRKVEM